MKRPGSNPVVREYLAKVRPFLPLRDGRDILLELESTIEDRVEDMAESLDRAPDEVLYRKALEDLGDPEAVAAQFGVERYLVAPEAYRPFLLFTCLAFVLHLALIGIATALDRPLHMGLFHMPPVGPNGLISVGAAAVHALLLDVGLMAIVFGIAGFMKRDITAPRASFRVLASTRDVSTRAVLTVLFAILLNFFRDTFCVVVVDGVAHPLSTAWLNEVIPLVNWVLAVSLLKDTLYGFLGERRFTLAADAAHGLLGVAITLHMLRGEAVFALPAIESFGDVHGPVNTFFAQLGTLVLTCVALTLCAKTFRRCVRFGQISH